MHRATRSHGFDAHRSHILTQSLENARSGTNSARSHVRTHFRPVVPGQLLDELDIWGKATDRSAQTGSIDHLEHFTNARARGREGLMDPTTA